MIEVVGHLMALVRNIVQIWEPKELILPSETTEKNSEEDGNMKVFRYPR